jgi:hypothetical protein
VENIENTIRNQLEEIYFRKSREILDKMRSIEILGKPSFNHANKLVGIFEEKFKLNSSTNTPINNQSDYYYTQNSHNSLDFSTTNSK